jgi:hypothetical protein
MNIPERCDPQGFIIRESNQNNTAYKQISHFVYTVDMAWKNKMQRHSFVEYLIKVLTFVKYVSCIQDTVCRDPAHL